MTEPGDLLEAPIPPEVAAVLSPIERLHFSLALRMNREPAKGLWTLWQRWLGTALVRLASHGLVRDFGFEHVEESCRRGAVLFVANHRTYLDMFVVSSLIHRRLTGRKRLYFPIMGYYYQRVAGLFYNQALAAWSMFPPLFAAPTHAISDRYALDLLCALCRRGPGTILGIHPEGRRNLNPDPYSLVKVQPGTGRIIHAARPIVIPVFIAGLHANVFRQMGRVFTRSEPVRVHFGAPVDLAPYDALPAKGSTYKAIVDDVMGQVMQLAERDRATFASEAPNR